MTSREPGFRPPRRDAPDGTESTPFVDLNVSAGDNHDSASDLDKVNTGSDLEMHLLADPTDVPHPHTLERLGLVPRHSTEATVPEPVAWENQVETTKPVSDFRTDDAPAVPADSAPAQRWYQKVLERAARVADAIMQPIDKYFKARRLEELRTNRTMWHELVPQMFAKNSKDEHQALQATVALEAAVGKILDLGGDDLYTIESVLSDKGTFGRTFIARDASQKKHVVKLSNVFDRQNMFFHPNDKHQTAVAKAAVPRALIMEVAALHKLKQLGDANPAAELEQAQFMPDPTNSDRRIAVVVMEYVEGMDLDGYAHSPSTEPLQTVAAIQQVVTGLSAAHRLGVVHSDVKPANIRVRSNGHVKLIDFGSSIVNRLILEQLHNDPTLKNVPNSTDPKLPQLPVYARPAADFSSPAYVPPGEISSAARDRYSLGRTIQRLVFGKDVFKSVPDMRAAQDSLTFPLRELAGIADQLLAESPNDRISLEHTNALLEELMHDETATNA